MILSIEKRGPVIQYVIPENCDDRILDLALNHLSNGELIIIPSDTNWIVVGDIRYKKAVEKIYRLKKQDKLKHFSLLCCSLKMANQVALISSQVFRSMKRKVPGHFTFILPAQKSITKSLKASKADQQVGLRIIPINWINKLIEKNGGPLISTHIDQQFLGIPDEEDIYSYLIEERLSHEVALTIDSGESEFAGISTIINFANEDEDVLTRQGVGIWP
jgi:tRNA threonylcarbamoyl adenosine modification protein (Sua5/YciO/YrdC/YwlC family)